MSKKKFVIKKSPATKPSSEAPAEELKEVPKAPQAPQKSAPQMPIPGEETVVMEAPPASNKVFKFYCVYCGQKLSAKGGMTGRAITCPTCAHQITIPVPP